MRKLLLLSLLLLPALAAAHPSDSTYCATGRGITQGHPIACHDSLGDAEEHVRRDDGPRDGYEDLHPGPPTPCPLLTSCDLEYTTILVPPQPLTAPQFFGIGGGLPHTPTEGCGTTDPDLACSSFTALMDRLRIGYGSVPGIVSGQFTSRPTAIENPSQVPPYKFRVHFGMRRLDTQPNGAGPGPWGLGLWQMFRCPDLYGVNTIPSWWPNICQLGVGGNITANNSRQSNSCEGRGNPCFPDSGNKVQYDVDFQWNGTPFTRAYSSIRDFPAQARMGLNWTHPYSGRLLFANSGLIWYLNEKNLIDRFRADPDAGADHYAAVHATGMTLYPEGSGASRTWIVVKGGERRRFNNAGHLIAIEYDDPARNVTLEFCPAPTTDSAHPDYNHPCKIKDALYKVRNALGRELVFDYADAASTRTTEGTNGEYEYWTFGSPDLATGTNGKLVSVIADGQPMVVYQYDALGRLTHADYAITGAGAGARQYHYAETTHVCKLGDGTSTATCPTHGFLHHLTGITDENGARFANFTYDQRGRATSTAYDADPSPTNTVEVSRYALRYTDTTTVVTHPSGMQETLHYGDQMFAKLDRKTTPNGDEVRTHDSNNRLTAVVDPRGVRTEYAYGAGDRVTSRIEAKGTPEQRTIETDWNVAFNKPTERRTRDAAGTVVAKQRWTYNARGQVLTSSMIDPVSNSARTTTMTYCEPPETEAQGSACPVAGLLKSVDGPRTDVADVTMYTYYSVTDESGCNTNNECHRRGDLRKITNALGQSVEALRYDHAGRVLTIRDANGTVTMFTYRPRGWLATRSVDSAVTTYAYDKTGQVEKITTPDGAYTTYDYDAAQRQTAVRDNDGNRIEYVLDAAGNITAERARDASGTLKRTHSQIYDTLGQLTQLLDAQERATKFEYDRNGNQTAVVNALDTRSEQQFDSLERLVRNVQDVGVGHINATTSYAYNARDQLLRITDPKGLNTDYVYDGFGDLIQLRSPDTGTTAYAYDAAGNLTDQIDARGVSTGYRYDALGRLSEVDYEATALDVELVYDEAHSTIGCTNSKAIGRLATMTDGSGSTRYCYDAKGQLTKKVQQTGTTTLTVAYRYANGGRLSGMTLPSGKAVEYGRDAQGRITSVSVDGEPLVTDVDYLPFGPVSRITYAGGHVQRRTFDQNYWSTGVRGEAPGSWGLQFEHDAIGNIVALNKPVAEPVADQDDGSAAPLGSPVETYTYDTLSRLTMVKDSEGMQIEGYTYDATGNRLSKQYGSVSGSQGDDNGDGDASREPVPTVPGGGGAEAYTYGSDNHRLQARGGLARTYDANGNTTGLSNENGTFTLTYGADSRLSVVHKGATQVVSNTYNGRGQRVRKVTDLNDLVFVYDEAGRLLGEYANGSAVREYVWMDDLPVGVRVDGSLYAIEVDHLGTPRRAFDPQNRATVWQWMFDGNPFGEQMPRQSAAGDSAAIELPLRYPGQYYDSEYGLHYNHYRDYEPGAGRYVQSDPVGLAGGNSTYGYVLGSPFSGIDPLGLSTLSQCANPVNAPACSAAGMGGASTGTTGSQLAHGVAATGMLAQGLLPNGVRQRDLSKDEEKQWQRHCKDSNDPCGALKTAVLQAIIEARGKMNKMLNDRKLENFFDTGSPRWKTHYDDLKGRLNSIWAMISLGQKIGCDMSKEAAMAVDLYLPNEPLP